MGKQTGLVLMASALLSLFGCFDKPSTVIERGPFVLKQYYRGGGLGGHARHPWKIYVNGARFTLAESGNNEFSDLRVGPKEEPPFVIFRDVTKAGGEVRSQVYLLRIGAGGAETVPLDFTQAGAGNWTEDGMRLVIRWREKDEKGMFSIHRAKLFDIATLTYTPLPSFPGEFITFSPDATSVVSVETEGYGEDAVRMLHQTTIASGTTTTIKLKAADYKWLGDRTHFEQYRTTANLWIASRLQWEQTPAGAFKLGLPAAGTE